MEDINLTKIFIEQATKIFIERAIKFFSKRPELVSDLSSFNNDLKASIMLHLTKSLNFSESISNSRQAESKNTLKHTIPLSLKLQLRRFISSGKLVESAEEDDILESHKNIIILGDPGAGKTTTLKRVIQKSYKQLLDGRINKAFWPIFLRMAEISKDEDLFIKLALELGIKYSTSYREIEYEEEVLIKESSDKIDEIKSSKEDQEVKLYDRIEYVKKSKKILEYKVGNLTLENALSQFFNEVGVILYLDGLDELHFSIREKVHSQIKNLSYCLSNSRIILTSRPFSEIVSFNQFNKFELQPLTRQQSEEIVNYWIGNSKLFFEILKDKPYNDLSNRPLFLNYLLVLFEDNNDSLPDQAVEIYRQIILLSIREWDEQKEVKIHRFSKYKWFNTFQKEDFISSLAFNLVYKQKVRKIFTKNQLNFAYLDIYKFYEKLISNDASSVIEDIESHNGLIINSFSDTYEFSHLSLQEYLCGKYILGIPISKEHYEYVNEYAAPLAIATILSPRSAEWFSTFILKYQTQVQINRVIRGDRIYEYLDRLIVEKISFPHPKLELGFSVLYLMTLFMTNRQVLNKIHKFLELKSVLDSLCEALANYIIVSVEEDIVKLELDKMIHTDLDVTIPFSISIHENFVNHLIEKYSITLYYKEGEEVSDEEIDDED